jgi:hypothetical protein
VRLNNYYKSSWGTQRALRPVGTNSGSSSVGTDVPI